MKKVILVPVICLIAGNMIFAQVGINSDNSTPDPAAMLDVKSTTKGLLPPRLSVSQRDGISSPVAGLIIWCTNCGPSGELQVYNGSSWTNMTGAKSGCGVYTITHIAGAVAPVTKTTTYGTVTGIPGETTKCWITSNLGSDHQASGVSGDYTEASAGWYWQFNRKQGYKHDGTTRTPNTAWITTINEALEWQPTNDPCFLELGTAWRIPTYTEWYNVDNTGGWTSWNGPWNAGLKIHGAGFLTNNDGSLQTRGNYGWYWSGSQNSLTSGWELDLTSTTCQTYYQPKTYGFSLRCIRTL